VRKKKDRLQEAHRPVGHSADGSAASDDKPSESSGESTGTGTPSPERRLLGFLDKLIGQKPPSSGDRKGPMQESPPAKGPPVEGALVWRAIFIGAALAIIAILGPSYLAMPVIGRTSLVVVTGNPDTGQQWGIAHKIELPAFSAGVAQDPDRDELLVAVPREKRVAAYPVWSPLDGSTTTASSQGPAGSASEARPPAPSRELRIDDGPVAIATVPELRTLLAVTSGSNDLTVLDLETGDISRTVSIGGRPVSVSVSEDLKTALIPDRDRSSVTIVDLVGFTVRSVHVEGMPHSVATQGPIAFVAAAGTTKLQVLDILAAAARDPIELGFSPGALGACGSRVFVADPSGKRVRSIDQYRPTSEVFLQIDGHPTALACIGDDRIAVATSKPARVEVWRLDTRTPNSPGNGESSQDKPSPTETVLPAVEGVREASFAAPIEATFATSVKEKGTAMAGAAFTGPRPTPTWFSALLVSANLAAVVLGAFVTGLIAKTRLGAHALALTGILLAAYWVIFRGAQPQALGEIVLFLGLPVLAAAGSGIWLSQLVSSRLKLQKESAQASSGTPGNSEV
jgi:DNA-binding beta-propeller fold protein YncE